MARFIVRSTIPCFVTWSTEIEADDFEAAQAKCRHGIAFDSDPEIGDSIPGAQGEEFEIEELT